MHLSIKFSGLSDARESKPSYTDKGRETGVSNALLTLSLVDLVPILVVALVVFYLLGSGNTALLGGGVYFDVTSGVVVLV